MNGNLKDDIKNAVCDIKDDFECDICRYNENNKTPSEMRFQEFQNEIFKTIGKKNDEHMDFQKRNMKNIDSHGINYAIFRVVIPQIFGVITGCALARLFCLGTVGYVIFMIAGAFLVGVHKSTYDDKISLKYAIIKNMVLITMEFIIILFMFIVGAVIYKLG